jgi:myosin heavy subunit
MYLNEATLLNNVRRRYKKDLIYVLKQSKEKKIF